MQEKEDTEESEATQSFHFYLLQLLLSVTRHLSHALTAGGWGEQERHSPSSPHWWSQGRDRHHADNHCNESRGINRDDCNEGMVSGPMK